VIRPAVAGKSFRKGRLHAALRALASYSLLNLFRFSRFPSSVPLDALEIPCFFIAD
jgi:hypothetical protein